MFNRFVKPILVSLLERRFFRFCLVGSVGACIDTTLFYLFCDPLKLGMNLTASKFGAAELALLCNFLLNNAWTFSDARPQQRPSTLPGRDPRQCRCTQRPGLLR
jgi:putative flippase GtrA